MEGIGAVAATTVVLAGVAALAGVALAPLFERQKGPATPGSILIAVGAAALSLGIVTSWSLGVDVTTASAAVVGLASIGAVVVVAVVVGRVGLAGLRLRERHIGTAVLAVAIALVALLPLAHFGFASWTAFINDFHRYALSAVSWVANSGPEPDFLERFTGAYGTGANRRGSLEKPGSTALIVIASTLTGISPAQLLTPLITLLTAMAVGSLAAVLRFTMGIGPLSATAIAAVGVLAPPNWNRVMDAQLGQVQSLALLTAAIAVVAIMARRPAERWFGATVATGILLAASIAANATVSVSALPLVGAIAITLLVTAGRTLASALVLAAVSVSVSAVLVVPAAAGIVFSIRSQSSGLADPPPLMLAHPLELLGIPVTIDSTAASFAWAAALVVVVLAGMRSARPAILLLPAAAATASALFLAVRYGLDSYELGKWLGLAMPIIGTFALGWMTARATRTTTGSPTDAVWARPAANRDPARTVAIGTAVILAISAVASSAGASSAVTRLVSADEFAAAAHPAIDERPSITVDTGDYYRDSILPARMDADRIAVAGATYAPAGQPISTDIFTTAARATERGWSVIERLPADYVVARIPGASLSQRWEGSAVSPQAVGNWLPPEPGGLWSAGPGPAWLVLPLAEDLPPSGATVRLGLLIPASAEEPRTLTIRLGERILEFPPSELSSRIVSLPLTDLDVVDGMIVIGLDLDSRGSLALISPSDTRELEAAITLVELSPGGEPPVVRSER